MTRRFIDTYVSKLKPAPEHTRPSLNNISRNTDFFTKFSYRLLEIANKTTDPNTERELRDMAEIGINMCNIINKFGKEDKII